MDIARVVGVIAAIVVVYVIYRNFFATKGGSTLTSQHPGTAQQVVSANKVRGANSANYSFSIWMFIEDWGYQYGQKKVILSRGNGDMELYLAPELNNMIFSTELTGGPAVAPVTGTSSSLALGCYNDRSARAMKTEKAFDDYLKAQKAFKKKLKEPKTMKSLEEATKKAQLKAATMEKIARKERQGREKAERDVVLAKFHGHMMASIYRDKLTKNQAISSFAKDNNMKVADVKEMAKNITNGTR